MSEKVSQIMVYSLVVVFVEYLVAALISSMFKVNFRSAMTPLYVVSVMFVVLTIASK
ncbi:MAG: hypothetical protein ACRCXZ_10735 [Patescibacteria group bacterium]